METMKKIRLLFRLAWSISPAYILVLLLSALLSGGQVLINVIMPKFLIDELTGHQAPDMLLLYGGIVVVGNVLIALINNLTKRYLEAKEAYMAEMMQFRMGEKIMNVEYPVLETPHYLDLKERAMFAIRNQSAMEGFIANTATLLNQAVTLVGLVVVMLTLSPVVAILLLLLAALNVYSNARFLRKQWEAMQRIIPHNRRYGYYIGLCYDEEMQKDIRLYDMADMLIGKVDQYNRQMNEEFDAMFMQQGRFLGFARALGDIQAALAYAYVGLRVFTDGLGPRIGIGSFTMYVSAAISFAKASAALGDSVVTMTQLLSYLDPFVAFMELPDEKALGGTAPMADTIESIRFENVSFAYPGSDRLVLENVSFAVDKGEKISIVGLNGAGKSTLVKLLCRLYRPTSGVIYVNGRDIFDYEHTGYMARVAAVFQDFKLFAFTVDENVTGKALDADPEGTRKVLEQVGFLDKLNTLPEGTHTLLGKGYNEDGTEFSGGEQQKVAIARALYKGAPLVILDEPTSALDPLAEAEIYEHFNALIGDKTALYISHRMSSSVFCDRILILDGGTVSDFDTHANLMRKTEGLYYKLFMSQADNYRLEQATGA